jgi:prophage regulatory protein
MPRPIIRKRALRQQVPYSDTQIWRLEKAGDFPARVQLGPGAVGWYQDEVSEWLENRVRGLGRRVPRARRTA